MIFNPEKLSERINKEFASEPFGINPPELYEPIRYFMNLGGKRLRPFLTLTGCYLFSDDFMKALYPAMAVEVFHNFTLMHDDIMDNAPLRRNKQTVHEKWDNNVAILSGDVMMIKAYEYLLKTDSGLYPTVLSKFNTCAIEVCEGQQLDVNFEKAQKVTEAEYLEMIRLKTAVLLGFSLELGALIGGASPKEASLLQFVGENIGIAFQLKDDLLDVYGDVEKFGKQVGGDIVANKKTFLLIKAFEKASSAQQKKLNELLSDTKGNTKDKIKNVTALFNDLDIRKETEKMIDVYIKKCLKDLEKVNTSLFKKGRLKSYLLTLAQREN